MAGKVYVGYVENHDNTAGEFMGVFSTAKRAKAAFGLSGAWEQHLFGNTSHWIYPDEYCDYIVYKTKIDDVIGYLG